MEQLGVISRVEELTEWCALRIPHKAKYKRHASCSLAQARYFSKLDTNSGFWQIPLAHPYSQRLSHLRADISSTDYLSGSLQPPSISKAE